MSDWDNNNKGDDNDERNDVYVDVQKSSLSYDYCGAHGIRYPSGASCPACDRDR